MMRALLKITAVLWLTLAITGTGKADSADFREIVTQFYQILLRDEPPTEQEELLFFGTDDDNKLGIFIRNRVDHPSKTVVWDYLRAHRELLMTKGTDPAHFPAGISTPFKSTRMDKPGSLETRPEQVLVQFPEARVSGSGYSGKAYVVFTRGEKCHIAIDVLDFARDGTNMFIMAAKELGLEPKRENERTR